MRTPLGALTFVCSLILLVPATSFAQKAKPINGESYKRMFTEANQMMGEGFVDTALHTFLLLYNSDTSNANIAYNIGQLYLQTSTRKADALPYLESASRHIVKNYHPDDPYEKNAPPPTYYYLARAEHLNYKFDNAIDNFSKFKKLLAKNDDRQADIDYWISCCNNGKILVQHPVDCKVINIGDSINSPYPDYCPILTADEQQLMFTSRRPSKYDTTKDQLGNYYEDIWISYTRPGGGWTAARNIGPPVNIPGGNDATVSISPDGGTLLQYKDDATGDGNIYVSYYRSNQWSFPTFIDSANSGVINSPAHEPSATLSPDGQTLYFVSDRPGGLGGTDIYKITMADNGKWANPVNLGPTINTKYDEDAPFLHPDDSTMFFSSKGHNTMGGFDVFTTRLNKQGGFDSVKNMGYPINTPDDDIYFTLSADGRRAYYSSVRPGGAGEKDIYEVIYKTPVPVVPVAVLVGYIRTPDGSPLPSDITVTTTQVTGSAINKAHVNQKTGKFLQVLRPNTSYRVVIASGGQTVFDQQFFLPSDSSYINLSRSFFRTSITLGDTSNVFVPHKNINGLASSKGINQDMNGQFLDDDKKPLGMMKVQLVNDKDSIIATTVTDKDGYFTFKKLDPTKNYLLKVDDVDDVRLKHMKNLYLADKDGKIVRDFDLKKKGAYYFGHLPVDLSTLEMLAMNDSHKEHTDQQKSENYSRDTANMPKSDADFIRYYAYNVDKIKVTDDDFVALIDKIVAKAASGNITFNVSGSASKVPTGDIFHHSNKFLASRRENDATSKIKKALKDKGVDLSKITFVTDSSVQGPTYLGDASDQVKYEKFQYVKVYVH